MESGIGEETSEKKPMWVGSVMSCQVLEVVAEGEVAQHLGEGVVPNGGAKRWCRRSPGRCVAPIRGGHDLVALARKYSGNAARISFVPCSGVFAGFHGLHLARGEPASKAPGGTPPPLGADSYVGSISLEASGFSND